MAFTLAEVQRVIRDTFDAKDRQRGVEGTFMWFMEEVGELATALRGLFAGEAVRSSAIPVLASYFHMNAEQYVLRFKAHSPIRLYYGPSLLKPAVLDLIARHFDGDARDASLFVQPTRVAGVAFEVGEHRRERGGPEW